MRLAVWPFARTRASSAVPIPVLVIQPSSLPAWRVTLTKVVPGSVAPAHAVRYSSVFDRMAIFEYRHRGAGTGPVRTGYDRTGKLE